MKFLDLDGDAEQLRTKSVIGEVCFAIVGIIDIVCFFFKKDRVPTATAAEIRLTLIWTLLLA